MIKYSNFRQVKVRFSDKGKGRTIVLLHGFLGSLEVWDEFANELSKKFRVISIDLPGHGETPSIGYIHSMELIAQCVKAVMDSLQLRRYVVVGHSMGGYAALAFADLFHDNVSGLCLFHSTSLPDSEEKKKERTKAIQIVKKDAKHYANDLVKNLFVHENIEAFSNEYKKCKNIAMNTSKQGIVNALEGMKERKKRDWILEFAKYPVLFIIGKKDTIIPYKSVLQQAELVKKPTILLLDDTAHMGFYEAKTETLSTLKKFAGKCFRE